MNDQEDILDLVHALTWHLAGCAEFELTDEQLLGEWGDLKEALDRGLSLLKARECFLDETLNALDARLTRLTGTAIH